MGPPQGRRAPRVGHISIVIHAAARAAWGTAGGEVDGVKAGQEFYQNMCMKVRLRFTVYRGTSLIRNIPP